MSESDIDAMILERAGDSDYWVLPENWETIELLAISAGCWRYGQDGKPIGMHYTDANVLADWHGISNDARKLLPIAVSAIVKG
jgi:hypothetical protein